MKASKRFAKTQNLFMSSQKKYEDILSEVAREVYRLVFGNNRDETLLQRIRNALRDFAAQEKKHCDYMKGQSVVSSDMLIPDKYKSPMRAMLSKHKYVKDGYGQKCIGAHLPNLDDNPKERQRRNYVSLAIIHDNMLPEAERINNDILPSELAGHIWELFSPYQVFDNDDRPWYGDKKSFLEVAMMSIQREVANKSAEKGQAKRRSVIGWIVEVFIALALLVICLYFFGVVTGIFVFAALLTIFHLLGWLEPIRAFIYNIVSHN